ncbi:hypothetical protein CTRI78_v000551 [Colletotrichum trifolii]|uniref:C2H2-type domain-containing protein n=1 Tax=Colletotrichum trifolii TaxID=5466 RepID=A0A4R8RRP6_COLTR|nr:hypothetical protein CTRI78_v000551 [Colletotrichum trifolii]
MPPSQSSPRSTLAVVLSASPKKRTGTPVRTVADDADDLIVSDLSPQFRRLAAQAAKGVSLTKPVLPAVAVEEAEATSSGVTPQPQPKKRGRPKGWKKDADGGPAPTPVRKLRPDRPKAGQMYAGRRRGRPPKAPSPRPRDIYDELNPHFNIYICEWKGCKAELHNFATLRKHVAVAHVKQSPFCCRWAKCAGRQPPHYFPTAADLESHIQTHHMPPIAWQVGDGPQVSFGLYTPPVDAELPDYLFDEAGNQVTPSVRDQREEDVVTWRMNRRRLKNLLLQREQNAPSEDEDEGMDAVAGSG